MDNIVFTVQDRLIINSYKPIVISLAEYLGNSYEIILHSLEDQKHSIIEIANGFHTGRKIGDPITDLAICWLKKIKEGDVETNQYSYFSKNPKGEPLKCTTIAIRGTENKIIGLLCINFYLKTPMIDIFSNMLPNQSSEFILENFQTYVTSIDSEINKASELVKKDVSIPVSQQKKEIIRILDAKNIFNIKNSVERVAEALQLSVNTVYFHLRNIAKTDDLSS